LDYLTHWSYLLHNIPISSYILYSTSIRSNLIQS